jgi:hypothetical protein
MARHQGVEQPCTLMGIGDSLNEDRADLRLHRSSVSSSPYPQAVLTNSSRFRTLTAAMTHSNTPSMLAFDPFGSSA